MKNGYKQIIDDLLECLEEYVCLHGYFANLGEAITFVEASKLTGRHIQPFIEAAYKEMVGDDLVSIENEESLQK